MFYQVMIRARAQSGYSYQTGWEPFAEPTRDRGVALRMVVQANMRRKEALMVQAEDAADLAELVRQLRRDEALAVEVLDVAVEEELFAEELPASWDEKRWQMERGAGGDHDAPYSFALPTSNSELRAWARLLARFRERSVVRAGA